MPRNAQETRTRILDAAHRLFYGEGIRNVSIDAVAEKAQLTKRTLYYHFASKDDLVAASLASRDQPSLDILAAWFDGAEGPPAEKVRAMFRNIAAAARHPKWKGCGFLRTVAELANMPGHPAIKVGARHKKKFETWLAKSLQAEGIADPAMLARQIVLLMDGAYSTALVHRDAEYAEAAGEAAAALIRRHETATTEHTKDTA